MTYLYLSRVRDFLAREVCQKFQLKRPDPQSADHFELVHPSAWVGWPEPARSDRGRDDRAPALAVGLSDPIRDDGSERILPIQIAVVVYAAGTVLQDGTLETDNTGYQDLLNFIDRITNAVINADEVGEGLTLANQEILVQPDNEQSQDFWLGQVAFTLRAPAAPRRAEAELI